MTPTKETIKPTMFMGVSRSLRKMRAAMGVTKGIMAMMAEPMTGGGVLQSVALEDEIEERLEHGR